MFVTYNYYKQHNAGKEIADHKAFYRVFSNTREFGGSFSNYDHLVKNRFMDIWGHVLNIILRKHPRNILDIGCGNGTNLPIARMFPAIEYHGLDYAESAIENARLQYPNIHFHVGDAFAMFAEPASFDLAILASVLILYRDEADRVKLLAEVRRVLREGGVCVLIVWNDSVLLRLSVKLSRVLGRCFRQALPDDFMGLHFSHSDIERLAKEANFCIDERIDTVHWYGILESVRYLNFSKYNRVFGAAESEASAEHPQSILRDLQRQAGERLNGLTALLYGIGRCVPSFFSMYTVYVLRKE